MMGSTRHRLVIDFGEIVDGDRDRRRRSGRLARIVGARGEADRRGKRHD
jgi:hypothetical protein